MITFFAILLSVVVQTAAANEFRTAPLPLVMAGGDPLVVFDAVVRDDIAFVDIAQVEAAVPVTLLAPDSLAFVVLASSANCVPLFRADRTAMFYYEDKLYVRADSVASAINCTYKAKRKSAGELRGYVLDALHATGSEVGDHAPGFRLQTPDSQEVWSEYLLGDSALVVAFIRSPDWEPFSRDLLTRLDANREQFAKRGARLAIIHGYPLFEAKQWQDSLGVTSPLLSDDVGAVALAYGVYNKPRLPNPAVFVIDKEGVIRWKHLYGEERDPPEMVPILEAVEGLKPETGNLKPE